MTLSNFETIGLHCAFLSLILLGQCGIFNDVRPVCDDILPIQNTCSSTIEIHYRVLHQPYGWSKVYVAL